jgi:predicted metal-binding membrane protein
VAALRRRRAVVVAAVVAALYLAWRSYEGAARKVS